MRRCGARLLAVSQCSRCRGERGLTLPQVRCAFDETSGRRTLRIRRRVRAAPPQSRTKSPARLHPMVRVHGSSAVGPPVGDHRPSGQRSSYRRADVAAIMSAAIRPMPVPQLMQAEMARESWARELDSRLHSPARHSLASSCSRSWRSSECDSGKSPSESNGAANRRILQLASSFFGSGDGVASSRRRARRTSLAMGDARADRSRRSERHREPDRPANGAFSGPGICRRTTAVTGRPR